MQLDPVAEPAQLWQLADWFCYAYMFAGAMHVGQSYRCIDVQQPKHDSRTRAMKLYLTAIVSVALSDNSLQYNHGDSSNKNKVQCLVHWQPNTRAWLAVSDNLARMLIHAAWVDPVPSRPVPRKVSQ